MGLVNDMMTEHREAIAYVFFGGLTTLVTWLTYPFFVYLGIDLNISNILSWTCGVLFAFGANKWFVFESRSLEKKKVATEFVSFVGSRIFTGVIAWVLFPILIYIGLDQQLFGTAGFVAKIVTSIIEIVLNWVLSKYFVFRKTGEEQPE